MRQFTNWDKIHEDGGDRELDNHYAQYGTDMWRRQHSQSSRLSPSHLKSDKVMTVAQDLQRLRTFH